MRLDKELHKRALAKSRTAAAELIANSAVLVNGTVCNKPAQIIGDDDVIEICDSSLPETLRYVSRGGLKLEHALNTFEIALDGKVCLDVGASTGGFTDCMLKRRALRVYAVDVGTSQLDASLRNNHRVVSHEQCDIRNFTPPENIDFIAADVSFISLKLILPSIAAFFHSCSYSCYYRNAILLIKPQFELEKKHKGVVTDKKTAEKITASIADFAEGLGFQVKGLLESPVLGKSGNREFLMWVGYKQEWSIK